MIDPEGKVEHKLSFFSGVKDSKGYNPTKIVTKAVEPGQEQRTHDRAWFVEIWMDGIPLVRCCATTLEGMDMKELEMPLIAQAFNLVFAAGMGNLMSLKRAES